MQVNKIARLEKEVAELRAENKALRQRFVDDGGKRSASPALDGAVPLEDEPMVDSGEAV